MEDLASPVRSDRVDLTRIVALREFEAFARLAMAPDAFDYVASGAWDEETLAELFDGRQPVGTLTDGSAAHRQLDVLEVAVHTRRRGLEPGEPIKGRNLA